MEIGQTVYLRPVEMGNAYRRDKSIKEAIIEKIGRKYITLKIYGQYHIDSRMEKTNFSSDYQFFVSKEELDLKIETEELAVKIKNCIPRYSEWDIDINKLRKIAVILNCN